MQNSPNLSLLKAVSVVLAACFFLWGCSQKRVSKDESLQQHYVDVTTKLFPPLPSDIHLAELGWFNSDDRVDLMLLARKGDGSFETHVYLSGIKTGFEERRNPELDATLTKGLRHVASGRINKDRYYDLVVLSSGQDGSKTAEVWFSNGQGIFYKKDKYSLPAISAGMDRVEFVDIDHDMDGDLLFYGKNVRDANGAAHPYPMQLLLNNSKGEFEDATELLLPPLPPGIVEASMADYDRDGTLDIFLVYSGARNRLLINNGLGKFVDRTEDFLPMIVDDSIHADWADFDMDGDNDLLVSNETGKNGVYNYFLENQGRGRFVSKRHKALPPISAHKVYLLDADENQIPDILLLTAKGPYYLGGYGKWRFKNETQRRLPRGHLFMEMHFADLTGDRFLDIIGIIGSKRVARVWVSRFK
ncbi:MAG: VCBS repeat-containing protein [Candidatus Nitrohelix vancouverensis]|uniref:VCBS repeat-containing protein n=1 Tax=Candidatus Nitrohelix vancouverensis TaxID=2705534 RepID=A0A7T0G4P3_9BACT|nr:MAG: VCBS repeat-containing protein [Candidatus Nitrohelix vancouverensis]